MRIKKRKTKLFLVDNFEQFYGACRGNLTY